MKVLFLMWQKIKSIFSKKPEVKLLPGELDSSNMESDKAEGSPYRTPAPSESGVVVSTKMSEFLTATVKKVNEERNAHLSLLMDDENLKRYFKTTIREIIDRVHLKPRESYEFFFASSCGVPEKCWPLFMEIFVKACKKIGLPVIVYDSNSLEVHPKKFLPAFAKLVPPRIDIDERAQAILSEIK